MRAVVKGIAPRKYTDYKDAVYDLKERIGWYCSYCEMRINNMIEIDHIVPQNNGGAVLDWDNFLLSCKYCNTRKSDKNSSRDGYIWPDKDNTHIAFQYSEHNIIQPKSNLSKELKDWANNTIKLCKLNKKCMDSPKDKDTRWQNRRDVWGIAERTYNNWIRQQRPEENIELIIEIAKGNGFYSIWTEVFKDEPNVLEALAKAFEGTYITKYDKKGIVIKRKGGLL